MENKLMLPTSYNSLDEEELTYTDGGASLAAGALYIYNYVWGLIETRSWLKNNQTGNVFQTATKAVDATMDYMSTSLLNTVRAVITGVQLVVLWPVTAVAWLAT